ncbi:MAG: histidine kinase [Dehalococcoidia bacterium]|nr:histidine kinase [Dehalococcoidia bacterium]
MQAAAPLARHPESNQSSSPTAERQPLEMHGRLLAGARVLFVAFTLIALEELVRNNHSLDGRYLTDDMPNWPRHEQIVRGLGMLHVSSDLPAWWFLTITYAAAIISFTLAAILFRFRSRQPIALLVGIFLMSTAVATYPADLNELAASHPWQAFLGSVATFPFPAGLVTLCFVFPDGRFVPRWTVFPVVLTLAGLAITFFPAPREATLGGALGDAVQLVALLILAIGAQIHRYRHASGFAQKRQLRLFLVGFGLLLGFFVVFNLAIDLGNLDRPNFPPVLAALFALGIGMVLTLTSVLLGVLLAASILRYRLFDIELILSRTLMLAGFTATIAIIYLAIVGIAGFVFSGATNGYATVVAAALVALAFQPLHHRLQGAANRLLYGERDNPYAALSGLSHRLALANTSVNVLDEIVGAITNTLKLPYATIRLAGSDRVEAARGTPAPIALRIPLSHAGQFLGDLEVAHWPGTSLSPRDRRLLEDLGRQSGAAISAALLTQDLIRSRERLVNALEDERRRLRRDLHDGLGPRLAGMLLRLDTVRDRLDPGSEAEAAIADLGELMAEAITDIRRLVYGLRPPALDDLGLVGALHRPSPQRPGLSPSLFEPPNRCRPCPPQSKSPPSASPRRR